MPRFSAAQNHDEAVILGEAARLAERFAHLRRPWKDCLPGPSGRDRSLSDLEFGPIPDEVAQPIHECFHYLSSFRPNSLNYGLKLGEHDRWPIAIASLSPFDLVNTLPGLENHGLRGSEVMVLSRVFAFDPAPQNCISFLLSSVRNELKHAAPGIRALVTYLNPNLGFTGASYRADNWVLLGEEQNTRYLYHHGNYITDRVAQQLLGPGFESRIGSGASDEITRSLCPLRPLLLYLRSPTANPSIPPRRFDRWSATPVRS